MSLLAAASLGALGGEAQAQGEASGPLPWALHLSGFVQVQAEGSQRSEDQLLQGGELLNQDRFTVRRARLRLEHVGAWTLAQLELDGNTVRGAAMSIRRANVGVWLGEDDAPAQPWLRLRAGLTEIPFGYELRQGQEALFFMERSRGSLALFPGPTDTGLRIDGGWRALRYDLAAQGGAPVSDQGGAVVGDPTAAPDLAGRLGAEGTLGGGALALSGGVSLLWGTGFHPGADAQKPSLAWRDLNENDALDTGEVIAVPGRGATPSYTFRRWAVGADLQVAWRPTWGETRLGLEAAVASNLDRGLFVADPITAGADLRHLILVGSLTQEVQGWLQAGLRVDHYNPDADLLDTRRGFRVPQDASLTTWSPLVGVALGGVGRLTFQYDVVQDALTRDVRGVPTDVRNNRWLLRLQGVL